MSPVWRLPTEILAEIASYTLPPRWFGEVCSGLSCTSAARGARQPLDHPHALAMGTHQPTRLPSIRRARGMDRRLCGVPTTLRVVSSGAQDPGRHQQKVIQNALWPLAERICELELQCPDGNSPFPRRLMALRRLWLTGPFGGTVYAPVANLPFGASPRTRVISGDARTR
ncbi:hypothetical protein EV121DRAFT_274402 [Schizophyllum commune]